MEPKFCGKLLTHHRRGYGVDVEALRDQCPLRQGARTGLDWFLVATEASGGGIPDLFCSWMFAEYMNIYRRKK